MDEREGQPGTENGQLITPLHAARARVERERRSPPLSPFHAEIAQGELAVSILVFSPPTSRPLGTPLPWIREWFEKERLPADGSWCPSHTVGLLATVNTTKQRQAKI